MDKMILEAWDNHSDKLKIAIAKLKMSKITYRSLLKLTLEIIFPKQDDFYIAPSSERIVKVDFGEWQGSIFFIIGDNSYQPDPSGHWFTYVYYGSCSGCDTLKRIKEWTRGLPNENQVDQFWTLCLHMMQKMKRMVDNADL